MRNLKLTVQKGFSQVFLLVGMLLIAISLPIATKLVQQNQENRSSAASSYKTIGTSCTKGSANTCCSSTTKCSCTQSTVNTSFYSWQVAGSCTDQEVCSNGKCNKVGSSGSVSTTKSTCNYTCTQWGACNSTTGKQTCYNQTASPTGCTGGTKITTQDCAASSGSNTEVSEITLNPSTSFNLTVNETRTIKVSYKPSSAINQSVTWSVNNSAIATVTSAGVVKGIKAGTTTITAKSANGKLANVAVTVVAKETVCSSNTCNSCADADSCKSKSLCIWDTNKCKDKIEKITLDMTSVNIEMGGTTTVMSIITPNTANQSIYCSSNDNSIATVSVSGTNKCIIKGIKKGTATVTISSKEDVSVKSTVLVTVQANGDTSIPVTGISLSKSALELPVNNSVSLGVNYEPSNVDVKKLTGKTVTWSVSGTSGIVSISDTSSTGVKITAKKLGTATVTAKNTTTGKTAKVVVTVIGTRTGSNCVSNTDCTTGYVCTGGVCVVAPSTGCSSSNCSGCTDPSPCTSIGCYWDNSVKTCTNKISSNPEGSNPFNSSACRALGGMCATYTSVLKTGASCKVVGYTKVGEIKTGLCPGSNKVVCCTGVTTVVNPNPNPNPNPGDPEVMATGITLSPATLPLTVGTSGTITATVVPSNATNKTVTWSSANTAVATVNSSGVVTAVATGSAVITAKTSNGKTATATVTVTNASTTTVNPTGITLNPTALPLTVGSTGMIVATVAPSNATDQTLTWLSNNTAVANVEFLAYPAVYDPTKPTGWMTHEVLVTPKSVGTAVITAKTSNGKTATTTVTVTAAGTPKISFKFSLRGIKPEATCMDELDKLTVEVINSPTVYQLGLSTDFEKVTGDGSTDSAGDQIFKVSGLILDPKFASVGTANRIKVKGPFHSKRSMCQDNQKSKLSEAITCNISLTSDTVYDFSGYKLLTGDIDQNGVINAVDYGIVKTNFDAGAEVECGRKGDLNLDGIVNSIDGNLISKESLSSIDDE